MAKQTLGELISSRRKELGYTQKDLANMMNVTDKAVSKWERNLSCPNINSLETLANTLQISVEELFQCSPKQESHYSLSTSILVFSAQQFVNSNNSKQNKTYCINC